MALSKPFDTAAVMRANYERRAKLVTEGLNRSAALKAMMPEGGMFIVVDVSATGLAGQEFAERLLDEKNVAVMPGASFGRQAVNFIRVSLTVDDEQLAIATERMVELAVQLIEHNDVLLRAKR